MTKPNPLRVRQFEMCRNALARLAEADQPDGGVLALLDHVNAAVLAIEIEAKTETDPAEIIVLTARL